MLRHLVTNEKMFVKSNKMLQVFDNQCSSDVKVACEFSKLDVGVQFSAAAPNQTKKVNSKSSFRSTGCYFLVNQKKIQFPLDLFRSSVIFIDIERN